MREHDLQPKVRRSYTTTSDSDSDHDQPIFPNLAEGLTPDGPDQLWVADMTYVPVIGGFVYVAIILDAWSRRVVGYAISRSAYARGSRRRCRRAEAAKGLRAPLGPRIAIC